MHALAALDHLLNFALPALVVGTLVASVSRFLMPKTAKATAWLARAAIDSVASLAVLVAGLVLTGHDGRMLAWTAMALAAATSEWCLRRGWRRVVS